MHLPDALVRTIDRVTQRLYVASGGRVGHRQGPWRMLLLTTTGRRSGEPRTHALLYLPHGDDLLVVASNNGADASPAWYLNLRDHPDVAVQRGRRTGPFTARTATEAERAELWPVLVRHNPAYRDHQARTRRVIPVVVLRPAGG